MLIKSATSMPIYKILILLVLFFKEGKQRIPDSEEGLVLGAGIDEEQ
jgi:hypothetical protein